ncbi:MAG: 2Fe-2S iron-sulfur cluster binding domain-containing protein [Gammaproteobacteria bacterium]|nr:2Fe-2S iron-sulfur cluster binding domain-containing protein [Gammaproteobacteria bacterium]
MSYQVTIEPLGETVEVEENQTILDACLRAGIWLPHACCHGLCATCKVQVLEGEVEHGEASPFALMDFEREEGKCLACVSIPESDLVIEADIDEDPDAEVHPVEDFTGRVVALEDLTPTAKRVLMELDRPMPFQAGQYLQLELPGIEQPRPFSMANPPSREGEVELQVRLVPGGEATTYIHERLAVGDELKLTGPYGRFFVRKSAPESMLFLAGGTGLSSPKGMILDLLENGETRPITLVHGVRNLSELYDREFFEGLAAEHDNFTYIPALSEPREDDAWEGATGFVHDVASARFNGEFRGNKAYICGPPVMIDACVTGLMRGRLFERDMFMEKFLSAADAAQDSQRSPLFRKV